MLTRVGRGMVIMMSVAVLVVAGVVWAVLTNLENDIQNPDILDPTGSPGANDGATDILLIGSDSRMDVNGVPLPDDVLKQELRTEASAGVNTDTIVLVRVPNDGGRAFAISIPRDAYVSIPNTEKGTISSAFRAGKQASEQRLRSTGIIDEQRLARESDQDGRKALVEAVQQLTETKVDHYAEINLYGFYLLTKVIGGVEVCLKRDVVEPNSGSNFKAGRQLIAGSDALSFVRQRHDLPHGDFDRIVRQQVFMAAVANRVLSTGVLTNRETIAELRDALERTTVIDAGWDVLDFALHLRDVATGNVEFVTIPVLDSAHLTEDGKSIVTIDETRVRAFTAGLLGGSTQPSSPPTTQQSTTPTLAPNELGPPITADGIPCVD